MSYVRKYGGIVYTNITTQTGLNIVSPVLAIIVTTPTKPQLNSKVGFDMKMTLDHHPSTHHHHNHHTNSMSSISQLFLIQF